MRVRDVIGSDARVFTKSKPDFKPDITIVTPTYRRNAEGLLRQCLQSALDQTFTNFEHIVIDDGSSDGTEEVMIELCEQDDRVVYIRHDRNSGLPAVRTNEGILRARGRAIAFLFDDNVFKPDFLAEAWSLLNQSGADVIHGEVDIPLADGTTVMFGGTPATLDLLRGINTIANGGVLIRRDFFDRFGLYDPHLAVRRLCDWELWMRSLWLGARFCRLPRVVAQEGGHLSATSLGNTVALDWKLCLPYVQDTQTYADRARRLRPDSILDQDVLDPERIWPYVREAGEWTTFVGSTYQPFLERHKIDFDPLLLTNRTELIDPAEGWNPSWALHRRRFRVLFLANAVPGLAAAFIDAVRAIPGAIVLNLPEWHLSMFEPGSLDVIVSVDGGSPGAEPHTERHRTAGTRFIYLSAYGEQQPLDTMPFDAVALSSSADVKKLFDPLPYFPQPGSARPAGLADFARRLRQMADMVIEAGRGGDRDRVGMPPLPVPALSTRGRQHASRIAYRLAHPAEGTSETISRSPEGTAGPASGESLASLVIERPASEIAVERQDLDALPRAELIALGCLAATRDVDIVAAHGEPLPEASQYEREAAAADWNAWFANLVRVTRLRHRLNVDPRDPLTVDIYLNSELFAGSEVYGLRIAKLLSELGIRARVRLPERNIYGDPTAINAWLAEQGLPQAVRAPYLPSMHHTFRPVEERAPAVARLDAFVRADPPDLILASGHIPQLVELLQRPPLFMAFFSAAAYQQTWLRDLHGQLHGILSDSAWALRPTAAVIGAPARVIPSPVMGAGGGEIARITANPRRWPVRVAIAGTVMPRKRQLEAVKAVSALRRRGYDIELNLYGFELDMTRDYVALVDATIASQGMTDHIVRHGFVEDGSEITRHNDIVLCASTDESLPQGLVFQMYQGLVGVTVLCGGVDEMVIDGKTGYLTRDPNPTGIAEALARALDDRPNWPVITEQARRRIRERCGSANVSVSLLELFEEGLALRQPGYRETQERALAALEAPGNAAGDGLLAARPGAAPDVARLPALLPQAERRDRGDGPTPPARSIGASTSVGDIIGKDARVTTRSHADWKPDITIVTPTYRRNAEGLLRQCLQSALDQTFTNFEHIVIDDGSSDGTEQVMIELCEQDERIVYVRHDKNSGLPAVRTNEGILRARGRAIAFLFDDNVFKPDFLAEAWSLLNQSGADVIHGEVNMPFGEGKNFLLGAFPLTLDLMRGMNTIANGGVLIRRDFFDRFGLYDPHLVARRLCDWELWMRSLSLGARFRHLPRLVAEEGGMVSSTSLGNTVALDWNTAYGYLQDTTTYAERSRRFSPTAILDQDVLDPSAVRRYVRDEAEWHKVIDQIYRPYLDRQGIDLDPTLHTNRAASVDPTLGWNPSWALHGRRFRVLFLANAMPALVTTIIESIRTIPGAIVINGPDWHLSALEPGSLDIIFLVDGASVDGSSLGSDLEAHRQTGTRIIYLALYGDQRGPAPFGAPDLGKNPYVISALGTGTPYFPQPGHGHADWQIAAGKELRAGSDRVVTAGTPASMVEVGLPALELPALASRDGAKYKIAYRLSPGTTVEGVSERVASFSGDSPGRISSESLASVVTSSPGAEILVEPSDLALLPLAERIGLGCLASRHGVSIVPVGERPATAESAAARAMMASQWEGWFANLARLMRLQQHLGSARRTPLVVDVYLMSELFSGSEAYGLGLAKCLHDLGVRVRVRVPQTPVYGGEHIAVNGWLAQNDVPLATRAPYIQGALWTARSSEERAETLKVLSDFVAQDPPDIIISSGYIPHLAHVRRRPPLFLALFSPAAYDQRELIGLRGRVDGLLSDSHWALNPSAAVIGTLGRVIRSTVFGQGGQMIERVATRPRSASVRIAVAGTLQPRKQQLEAVKAVAMLRRQGYDVELNLYGYALEALSAYIDRIDATIRDEGLEAHVRRHGFVEDGSRISHDNDIVLSASIDESLPQGLLFQMYKGLVAVAVVCGGIDEIVVDGKTGYTTHDSTPQGIAAALARSIDNRDRWREVAENAQRAVFAECSIAHTTSRLIDLIEEGVVLRAPASEEHEIHPPRRRERTVIADTTDAVSAARNRPVSEINATKRSPILAASETRRSHFDRAIASELVFETKTEGLCGLDVSASGGTSLEAILVSTNRPSVVLRRSFAEVDPRLGTARFRWTPIQGYGSHRFKLLTKVVRSGPGEDVGLRMRPSLRITGIVHQTG